MATSPATNGVHEEEPSVPLVGQYNLVAWDLDLTGRRLIDEICQIAAYTPASKFAQHVMPYRNLNPAAQYRHNIRIVSIGRYRAMRNNKTGKILKTKSEISALTDFLTWLESVRGKDGVILLSYETRKVVPHILLEAFSKYNMLENFRAVVKGFVDGYAVAEAKCAKTITSFSLRTVSRVLLDNTEEMFSAMDRARFAFQVVEQMCAPDDCPDRDQGGGDGVPIQSKDLVLALGPFVHVIDSELGELAALKSVLQRQSTLRPIFGPMVNKNRRERQRCSVQKQVIAEAGLDYAQLESAYKESGKESLSKLLTTTMTKVNSKVIEELIALLVGYFNPPEPKTPADVKLEEEGKQDDEKNVITEGTDIKSIINGEKENGKTDIHDGLLSSPGDTATTSPSKCASSDFNTSGDSSPIKSSSSSSPRKPSSPEKVLASSPKNQ